MIMRIINFIALAAGFTGMSLIGSCSSSQIITTSNVKNGGVVVDGSESDWMNKFIVFTDQKLVVGTQYDDENIYVCIKSNDQTTMRKILGLGLSLTFVNENDKNEKFTIKYPIGGGPGFRMKPGNPDGEGAPGMRPDHETGKDAPEMRNNELEIIPNDKEEEKAVYTLDEFQKHFNAKIKISKANEIFVYELSIPRKGKLFNLKIDEKSDVPFLSLNILTNKFERPEGRGNLPIGGISGGGGGMQGGGEEGMPGGGMQGGAMGGGRGGRGGGHGGGMPGGGGRPSDDAMQEMTKQIELNLKIAISAHK